MAILTDFHLHSTFSGDGKSTMEEMIQKAITLGLTHVCFTEHHDIDYVYSNDLTPGCFEVNADSYLYDLLKLRAKYADQIKVMFGIELGLQPHLKKELAVYSKSHDFDFIIGSTHICNRMDPYYPEFFEGRSEDEAHHEYFTTVLESIKKLPYFDVYGHLDYVVRYGPTKGDQYTYEKHKEVFDDILRALLEEERGLELNTGAFRHGLLQPNPCFDVLKRYRELGGEIITVGSDAHDITNIGLGFDKASDILKEAGFKYYTIFEGRTPEFFKL